MLGQTPANFGATGDQSCPPSPLAPFSDTNILMLPNEVATGLHTLVPRTTTEQGRRRGPALPSPPLWDHQGADGVSPPLTRRFRRPQPPPPPAWEGYPTKRRTAVVLLIKRLFPLGPHNWPHHTPFHSLSVIQQLICFAPIPKAPVSFSPISLRSHRWLCSLPITRDLSCSLYR